MSDMNRDSAQASFNPFRDDFGTPVARPRNPWADGLGRGLSPGDIARDEAMDRAERAAADGWNADARALFRAVAERLEYLTTDDVWEAGLEPPREPRALGSIVRAMTKAGVIEPTAHHITCRRPSRHSGTVRVHRSLVFQPPVHL